MNPSTRRIAKPAAEKAVVPPRILTDVLVPQRHPSPTTYAVPTLSAETGHVRLEKTDPSNADTPHHERTPDDGAALNEANAVGDRKHLNSARNASLGVRRSGNGAERPFQQSRIRTFRSLHGGRTSRQRSVTIRW
ncbi:hypothetical protein KEM60_02380 [Austwickia sp. TVS 96-490-7B]|nr:hypothetical protein [Austwickia sp. TVS 96-490-7B]